MRYSREVRGTVWTQFREGGAAQAALNARMIAAGAIDWEVTDSVPTVFRLSLETPFSSFSFTFGPRKRLMSLSLGNWVRLIRTRRFSSEN